MVQVLSRMDLFWFQIKGSFSLPRLQPLVFIDHVMNGLR